MVAEYSTVSASTTEAKISYLTSDHLGSPRITTDSFGKVISRRDFHPYGEEIARANYGSDTVRKKFATYERDTETTLDYAQARYYSSKIGRFYSVDPENAGASEADPQSWNAYAYGRNNPVLYIDPEGLDYKVCYANAAGCFDYTNKQFAAYISDIKSAGFVAQGEAKNGNIVDVETGNAIASFSYFTTWEQDTVAALVSDPKRTLEIWAPIVELVQPMPIPGGAILGGVVKGSKVFRTLQKAKWAAGIIKYKKGANTALDHVLARHGAGTTFKGVGKFASSSSRTVQRLADEAISNLNGSQFPTPDGGIIYDFGKVIGTHLDGTLTTKVKIFFNSAGEITSFFPVVVK